MSETEKNYWNEENFLKAAKEYFKQYPGDAKKFSDEVQDAFNRANVSIATRYTLIDIPFHGDQKVSPKSLDNLRRISILGYFAAFVAEYLSKN